MPPRPSVRAGAGSVALASSTAPAGRMPWGRGPGLAPIEWAGAAMPWWDRDAAMSLPTVSRARNLICSAVGALPFSAWEIDETVIPSVSRRRPPPGWTRRPDPDRTRQWLLAWTTDDLFFYGAAHWLVTARYARPDDYPRTFTRLTPGDFRVDDQGRATINGTEVDPRDVVEFLSPVDGLLTTGFRALSIAVALDDAADRFAGTEIPAGVLEIQPGGEPLSPEDMTLLGETFTQARRTNTTAVTNENVRYREIQVDASAMQLVEGRTYQALELARMCNVPPYLVGAPAGTGMTYLNAETARADLIDYGALPFIGCIEQTLSGPNVTPGPLSIRLETNAWLRSPFTGQNPPTPSPNDMQIADQFPVPA